MKTRKKLLLGITAMLLFAGCHVPPPCIVPPAPLVYTMAEGNCVEASPGGEGDFYADAGCQEKLGREPRPDLDLEACDLPDLRKATRDYGAATVIETAGCEAVRDRIDELHRYQILWDQMGSCVEGVTRALEGLQAAGPVRWGIG